MDRFVFDDSLRTGHSQIDEQHEWLFGLANRVAARVGSCDLASEVSPVPELVGAECAERVEDAVSDAVYGLVDYATEHFADEEAIMADAHYPLASVHAGFHAELSSRLAAFVITLVNEGDVAAEELTTFFIEWLTTHIMEHDREFTEWLASHPAL